MIERRTFIKGASTAAITATASGIHVGQGHAQQVPNSVGIEPPKLKAPANAADCHMHTYDPARFPMPPNPRVAPTNATVEDYRLLQKRLGTARAVVVTPAVYATDNRVTLAAIAQLGAILILAKPENRQRLPFFAGIERVRYRRPVRPGDVVVIEAHVVRLRSRMGMLKGVARVNGVSVLVAGA